MPHNVPKWAKENGPPSYWKAEIRWCLRLHYFFFFVLNACSIFLMASFFASSVISM